MASENPLEQKGFSARDTWIVVCSALVLALAPSFQSFWIDEGTMALISRSTPFYKQILLGHMNASETMMPFATTYFWLVEKIVGDSEWALRLGNLPWLWFGIVCMALIGKRTGWSWLPLLFAIHPVVWFYADEVRPYAIQLGAGCWLALGFVQLLQSEGRQSRGFWNFGFASAVIISASFLGIFVVAAVGLVLLVQAFWGRWFLTARQYGILGCVAAMNLVLVIIMVLKIHTGAEGGRVWTVGISNLAFATYELLGFVGLGPGRELIRSSAATGGSAAATQLLIPSFFKLGLLLVIYMGLVYAAFRASKNSAAKPALHMALLSCSVAILSVGCLLGASLASSFPFWGRHLVPTLPFVLLAVAGVAAAIRSVWTKRQKAFLLVPLFVVLLYSSCVIRWSPSHAKDDYRTASGIAREYIAMGKQVCWIAAPGPALYYQLSLSNAWPPKPGTASIALPDPGSRSHPDIILVSKPDVFDHQRFLPQWINSPGIETSAPCQSFVVYQLSPSL
jgi:hypothetical protein